MLCLSFLCISANSKYIPQIKVYYILPSISCCVLDLKSVKCVCIETAQTWTYFTYFTYFIYIDIHNRILGYCMNWYSNTILLYLLKKRNMQQLTMDNTKYNIRINWKEDHMPFRNLRWKINNKYTTFRVLMWSGHLDYDLQCEQSGF